MKKIVLTCVLVFSACCVTLFAQKDKKEKETVKIEYRRKIKEILIINE